MTVIRWKYRYTGSEIDPLAASTEAAEWCPPGFRLLGEPSLGDWFCESEVMYIYGRPPLRANTWFCDVTAEAEGDNA